MDAFQNPQLWKNLQELLYPPENSSDSEDDSPLPNKNSVKLGPGQIGNTTSVKNDNKEEKVEEKKDSASVKDDEEEIQKWLQKQHQEDSEILDKRKRPEYKISYKQAIGTEDVFLHMNNRTSASMSCEDMIIDIDLPDETVKVDEMDLKITENEIDLKTPLYRLKLNLMHNINPDIGTAKYDSEKRILTLTLRIKRELDYANF